VEGEDIRDELKYANEHLQQRNRFGGTYEAMSG
jgi:hypothetical protein